LVANSIWRSHLKNSWRILCESCPSSYFFPDGKRIIFSSNLDDERGRNFDIYTINVDGSALERVTFNDTFDGFPMFSPDGKKIVFLIKVVEA
jgi:tricorn protease-like protein